MRRSHAKPLMHQLHRLPVQHRIDYKPYKVSVLTYTTLNTSVPCYLSPTTHQPPRQRTDTALDGYATAHQSFARTDFAKRSFRCAATPVWNSLLRLSSRFWGDFVPQTANRGFAPAPHLGTSFPRSPTRHPQRGGRSSKFCRLEPPLSVTAGS